MNYSHEPAIPEAHCISVWGAAVEKVTEWKSDAQGNSCRIISSEVEAWLEANKDDVIYYLGGGEDDHNQVYSFRFTTREAAMLFKLTFG